MTGKIIVYEEGDDTEIGSILLDDQDYEKLNGYTWYLDQHGKPFRRVTRSNGSLGLLYLARDIFNLPIGDGRVVYYKDTSNYLDNRRSNLVLKKARINRRTQRSSRGHLWPYKVDTYREFLAERPDREFQENKTERDDLLYMIDNAIEISWKIPKIEFTYGIGTEEYKLAGNTINRAMFTTMLNYYFDWDGKFLITGTKKYKKPEKSLLLDEETEVGVVEETDKIEDTLEESSKQDAVDLSANTDIKENVNDNTVLDVYEPDYPRYVNKSFSKVPSKILIRELIDRSDVREVISEVMPLAPLEVLMREINNRSTMKCKIEFS